MANAFRSRFPDIDLTVVVDYSKYHDVRVDNQLATGTLVPDVVQLQTLQDFTRWARRKAGPPEELFRPVRAAAGGGKALAPEVANTSPVPWPLREPP